MNILIAIDSFKGSLSSIEANKAVAEGIQQSSLESTVSITPLADGGEGTVDTFIYNGAEKVTCEVTGPLGETIETYYSKVNVETAVIEIANICGLPLVPKSKQNPLYTTTYGVGEAISHAALNGCKHIIIGLGGSSTNDGGIGMLQALGVEFLDTDGSPISLGAEGLLKLSSINVEKLNPILNGVQFTVASDVTNPLCGDQGASAIFGPQKGLTEELIPVLDEALLNYSRLTKAAIEKEIVEIPGSGAAGGLGAALFGYLNAELVSGVDFIIDYLQLEEKIMQSDLVITGEGRLDRQTTMGKAPIGIAKLCQKHKIPVIGLAGSVDNDYRDLLVENGFTSCFSILFGPMDLNKAMLPSVTTSNLKNTGFQLGNLLNTVALR